MLYFFIQILSSSYYASVEIFRWYKISLTNQTWKCLINLCTFANSPKSIHIPMYSMDHQSCHIYSPFIAFFFILLQQASSHSQGKTIKTDYQWYIFRSSCSKSTWLHRATFFRSSCSKPGVNATRGSKKNLQKVVFSWNL